MMINGDYLFPTAPAKLGDVLQGVEGFRAKHTINRDNKRDKHALVLLTLVVIFLFLLLLRGNETFHGIFAGSLLE